MHIHRHFSVRALAVAASALLLTAVVLRATPQPSTGGGTLVYFGTYTGQKSTSKGVYVSRLDLATGGLSKPELAAETSNPSFLAADPKGAFLYAVNEIGTFGGKPTGAVSAFSIDKSTGRLTALNQQASEGGGPAHLTVDKAGRHVLVANYGGGSVAVLPIGADGRLQPASAAVQHTGSSVNPTRQTKPHAHAINLDPENRFAYVPDLGLDKVMIYRFDAAKGTLAPGEPPFAAVTPGAGPRHIALSPSGRTAWVINEIDCTVTTFTRDARTGGLTAAQTISTLPAGLAMAPDFSTAEVLLHPSGRFLYGSNRGHHSLTVFAVDDKTGALTFVQNQSTLGRTPRGFGIDPTGAFLVAANQGSDSVVVFRIDRATGRLTPAGQTIEVGTPVSVEFVK
jgi:6-phosphogluconolactonase